MLEPYMLLAYSLVMFYAVLCVSLVRKARKPSCRTCVFWQHCLSSRVGITDTPPKRCF